MANQSKFTIVNSIKLLAILFFLLAAFYNNAQTKINYESFLDFHSEEKKLNDYFSSLNKNANENIFVLDSSIRITNKINFNDTIWDYFKYNELGNLVEVVNLTTYRDASGPHNFKKQYTYDENDNVIILINYDLEFETKKWTAVGKTEFNFNEDGNLIESIFFRYDTLIQNWIHNLKIVENYDVSGRQTGKTYYFLNDSQEWITERKMQREYFEGDSLRSIITEYEWNENQGNIPKQKFEITYDKQGRLLSSIAYKWDETNNELVYSYKQIRVYNDNEGQTFIKYYNYNTTSCDWIEDRFEEVLYEGENEIKSTYYNWNSELNQWVFSSKYERSYDIKGNETSFSVFDWDIDHNTWKGLQKTETTYNSKGMLESISAFNTNVTGQWIGIDKKEYFYNEDVQEVKYIYSDWEPISNDWVFNYKVEKDYNSDDQIILETSFDWDKIKEDWFATSEKIYEYDIYGNKIKEIKNLLRNSVWVVDYANNYFYSPLTTNIRTYFSDSQLIKIYPNPVNETFTIETQNQETVFGKLYNLNGELIKNITVQQGINTYNISDQKNGIYFIQIPQKEGMFVIKLVKN